MLQRFEAYGWHTQQVDGHDMAAVDAAIENARAAADRPSIIACRTTIGYGSPNRAGTAKAHGEPLGEEEVQLTRRNLGLSDWPPFHVPEEVLAYTRTSLDRGAQWQAEWERRMAAYRVDHPREAEELQRRLEGKLPEGWEDFSVEFPPDRPLATRAASGATLKQLIPRIPQLIGGSADLSGSNNTLTEHQRPIRRDDVTGRYIHYGVREHGMGAIMNGLALHGGFIPYGGTFLVFSDYMRASIRLAAMMEQRVIYVFTHDSIGLGEDGPTHQPIEHLAGLRAMPNLTVIRPTDAAETVEAWKAALRNTTGPTALILTRQKLPVLPRDGEFPSAEGLHRGAYVLQGAEKAQAIIIASGSEVGIALEAHQKLKEQGILTKVVAMPSWELFDRQPENYRDAVLPPRIRARVAVEAGATLGWHKYVGDCGEVIGLDRFGASAPYTDLYRHLGITAEAVVEAVMRAIQKANR
ncbi:MAG: transketolase [Calditrichaeota bacterium]|nr:MAG: transketolase [Calditrichota bacterium]